MEEDGLSYDREGIGITRSMGIEEMMMMMMMMLLRWYDTFDGCMSLDVGLVVVR